MSARRLSRLHNVLLLAALALVLTLVLLSDPAIRAIGEAEGRAYPVAARATITRAEADGAGSLIWGHSRKLRGCAFVGIESRLKTGRGTVPLDVEFRDAATIRPRGDFSFGPWWVQVPPEHLGSTVATAVHRCHPFWLTRTEFWP